MLKPNQSISCSLLWFSIIERYKFSTLACEVYNRVYLILHSTHLPLLLISFLEKKMAIWSKKNPALINTKLERKKKLFSGEPAKLTFYLKKHSS